MGLKEMVDELVGKKNITKDVIDAIGKEDYKEKDDFYKLAELLKGLAAESDKDDMAKSFLRKVGVAIQGLAKGAEDAE